MVGLSDADGRLVVKKMMENRCFQLVNEKIHVKDVKEISRQTAYFNKMQQIEKSRKEKSASLSYF
jgi:hypothetical protein